MEKVGIIQLDEMNLKLTILEVSPGGYFNIIYRVSECTRLRQYIDVEGLVNAAKISETLSLLKMYRKICDNFEVTKIITVSNNFVKEARNQKSFFDEIYNNTTFTFTMLTDEEELKCLYLGVIGSVEVPKGVIIDVQPYYTNIIQYNRRMFLNTVSLPFGSVTFSEQNANYETVLKEVASHSELDFLKNIDEDIVFVGTGNIFISAGRLAKRVCHYPLNIDNNYNMDANSFQTVFKKIEGLDVDSTSKVRGVSEERADLLFAGMCIIKAIIDTYNISNITISTGDVTDGLIFNYVVPEVNEKPLSDMLSYSLESLRVFYDGRYSNTQTVYNLAVILFKQLKVMHRLPRMYVKALRIAASMYDCGKRVNYDNYSNYSFDIVVNSKITGASHKDLLLAGFACKYQNLDNIVLADWVKYKDILTEEDLEAVRKLAVIINLAANLDKSNSHNVTDVCCDILGDSIIMKTVVKDDATFDIKQGMKVGQDFRKILKKFLQVI